ncbi:MAG: hypothetical protein ACXQT5_07635 [Candidatus Syntropharchaeia archaeon]
MLYQNDSHYLFILKIEWDSEKDSEEFFDAYGEMVSKLENEGILKEENLRKWKVRNEYIWLSKTGNTTTIVGSSDEIYDEFFLPFNQKYVS